jgi:hypothetical protein
VSSASFSSFYHAHVQSRSLWNYNPDNSDEHGDHWNGENFSWFSRSRATRTVDLAPAPEGVSGFAQTDASLDAGGRILGAVVRPYASKVAGKPLRVAWDPLTGIFEFEFAPGASSGLKTRETEIFVPDSIARGYRLEVDGVDTGAGDQWVYRKEVQTFFLVHGPETDGRIIELKINLGPPASPPFTLSLFRERLISIVGALLALFIAVVAFIVTS